MLWRKFFILIRKSCWKSISDVMQNCRLSSILSPTLQPQQFHKFLIVQHLPKNMQNCWIDSNNDSIIIIYSIPDISFSHSDHKLFIIHTHKWWCSVIYMLSAICYYLTTNPVIVFHSLMKIDSCMTIYWKWKWKWELHVKDRNVDRKNWKGSWSAFNRIPC